MRQYLILFILILFSKWTLAQYHHDSIKVEHGYLHYYVTGNGKPIVHLQGGPGFSSYYLRGIADSLPHYQNILIDYQGTGRSQYHPADSSWVSIGQIVNDVELVRKKLKISKWIVTGHSWGGAFALHYAVKFPQRVNSVISIGGVGTDSKLALYFDDNLHSKLTEEELQRDVQLYEDSSRTNKDKLFETLQLHNPAYFFDRKKSNEFLSSFPAEELERLYNEDFAHAYLSHSDFMKYDIGKEVYKLNLPIRIIQGRQDPVGEGIAVLLNERSKNSKIYFVEKAGHFPWLEQPKEFFGILADYLEN